MRRARRGESGGEIAMMAVITKAMGAFLIIMVMLLPSYVGGRSAADQAEEQIKKAEQEIETAQQIAAGELTPEEIARLKRRLEAAKKALEEANKKIAELESKIDLYENRIKELEKESEEQKKRISELEEKLKTLVHEPLILMVDMSRCDGLKGNDFDLVTLLSSNDSTSLYSYYKFHTFAITRYRGLKPGDEIYPVFILQRDKTSDGAPIECTFYTIASYGPGIGGGYFVDPVKITAGKPIFFTTSYKIEEEFGISRIDPKDQYASDLEDAQPRIAMWKQLFSPAKNPDEIEYVKMTPELNAAIDRQSKKGTLTPLFRGIIPEYITWNRIPPEVMVERLAALEKELEKKPDSRKGESEADNKQNSGAEETGAPNSLKAIDTSK